MSVRLRATTGKDGPTTCVTHTRQLLAAKAQQQQEEQQQQEQQQQVSVYMHNI